MDFDEKQARRLIKKGFTPRSVNGYIVMRKGGESKGIGLKDTPEGWEAIAKLQGEVATEVARHERVANPVAKTGGSSANTEAQVPLQEGETKTDRRVGEMVGREPGVKSQVDASPIPDQHILDASRNHALNSALSEMTFYGLSPYVKPYIDKIEKEELGADGKPTVKAVANAFQMCWNDCVAPQLGNTKHILELEFVLSQAKIKMNEIVQLYMAKQVECDKLESALKGLHKNYEILTLSTCEPCRLKFLTAMGTMAAIMPSEQEIKKFQEEHK